VWPIVGEATPQDLLYICRTSLPSLLAAPLAGVELAPPAPGLAEFPYRSMVADLTKTALGALIAYRPTHLVFDFIDERLDMLSVGGTLVTHSWELDVSGFLNQPAFTGARTIRRTTSASDLLWRQAMREMAALIASTPLSEARLVLHEAQWATTFVDTDGGAAPLPPEVEIFTGKPASIEAHNAALRRYQEAFVDLLPGAARIAAPAELRVADAGHRWGLSPFHYVEGYYRDIHAQLQALGV
jgi:hypothetical protein